MSLDLHLSVDDPSDEPDALADLPGMWEAADLIGGQTDMDEPAGDVK